LKKPYGRVFLNSLPDYAKTTDMRVVERFFGHESGGDPKL